MDLFLQRIKSSYKKRDLFIQKKSSTFFLPSKHVKDIESILNFIRGFWHNNSYSPDKLLLGTFIISLSQNLRLFQISEVTDSAGLKINWSFD